MANFKITLKEGITTGCLTKTAIIEADSKEEAMKTLLGDIDWDEDYDVEFDASPEYRIEEMK